VETCDVLIAGGGPAGSACAWQLRKAGFDVIVVDKATFPRDKVCAGWITPQVVDELQLDIGAYREGRTFQPITGFRVGVVGAPDTIDATYDHPVSYGIRRCEFDEYLLQRSGVRLRLGTPIASIRRDQNRWVVNDVFSAPMLVGAGGHFCPVARTLNGVPGRAALISAQEVEFRIDAREVASIKVAAEYPELYFCSDLKGYGWCFRKQDYLNIGFGRLDSRALPKSSAEFVDFLKVRRTIPASATWRWHGHAYLVAEPVSRRAVGDGVMLVGDAAGLAYPQSGEGIRPAIESGLMAASTILKADGCYTRDRLGPYEAGFRRRVSTSPFGRLLSRAIPESLPAALARPFLGSSWFVRHVVLNRWFLHAHQPALELS
jgi:flavin-dependent dehydrogenase